MIIAVMMVSLIAVLFEYRSLKEQSRYREIYISGSLMFIGLILSALVYFKVKMPTPLSAIYTLFKPISQYVTKLLS